VTDNGGGNYWRSDDSDRHDYLAAIDMGDWIRDLGLAYQLTGEDRYARTAIDLIHHWFINDATKMRPTVDNKANPWSIEIYITVPKMIYGASMVRDHSYWDEQIGDGMNGWMQQFLGSAETHEGWAAHNNIYAWAVQTRAVSAAYLDDEQALQSAFDDWKSTAVDQVDADGKLQHELGRGDRNLFYSLYGLKALTLTAEIARQHGTDLYHYDDGNGVVLRRAFDYHAPYAQNPGSWPHHSNPDMSGSERASNIATYELAYSVYQDGEYLETVRSAGRPVTDQRILGVTTLTHGNLFDISSTDN